MRQASSIFQNIPLETHLFRNRPPQTDLAFEAYLLATGRPSLTVYLWSHPVLVLGRGQSVESIDQQVCRAEAIPVLRRQSGGTGVLHNKTLNIGLVLPKSHPWVHNIRGLYEQLVSPISQTLNRRGIPTTRNGHTGAPTQPRTPICFETHGDDSVFLDGRKVFGGAQRRTKDAVLVHGTLILDLDVPQQSRVFRVPKARIENAMTAMPEGTEPMGLAESITQTIKQCVDNGNTLSLTTR